MIIFAGIDGVQNRGRVQVIDQPGSAGSVLGLTGWQGFGGFKSIFTTMGLAAQTNYRFMHTIGGEIHLYTFRGDQIGQAQLGGVSFQDNCQGLPEIGFGYVLEYYRQNRLSARLNPLQISLGLSSVFAAYMTGIRGQMVDVEQRLFQFSLQLALVPQT